MVSDPAQTTPPTKQGVLGLARFADTTQSIADTGASNYTFER